MNPQIIANTQIAKDLFQADCVYIDTCGCVPLIKKGSVVSDIQKNWEGILEQYARADIQEYLVEPWRAVANDMGRLRARRKIRCSRHQAGEIKGRTIGTLAKADLEKDHQRRELLEIQAEMLMSVYRSERTEPLEDARPKMSRIRSFIEHPQAYLPRGVTTPIWSYSRLLPPGPIDRSIYLESVTEALRGKTVYVITRDLGLMDLYNHIPLLFEKEMPRDLYLLSAPVESIDEHLTPTGLRFSGEFAVSQREKTIK